MKEYKNYSKTKKKLLVESIRLAKEMIESKNKGEEEKEKIRKNINRDSQAAQDNFLKPERKKISKSLSNA
jgi:hypothetical protein